MKRIKLMGILKSDDEVARGLMWRESIPEDEAMLFVYERPHVLSYWMANTYIPLQIAFVSPSMRLVKTARMQACSLDSVLSGEPCVMAFEMLDGAFDKLGIREGQIVAIDEEANELVITEPGDEPNNEK